MKIWTLRIGRIKKGAIFIVALLCLGLWTSGAAAAENPVAVVRTGTNQVMHLLRQNPEKSPLISQKIQAVVNNYFDFNAIAKKALGPQWRRLSPAKREQFTRAFSKVLFNTYIKRIKGYSNESIRYALLQREGNNAEVRAYVTGVQNIAPVSVDFYLHAKGTWKVEDVVVSGVGLVTNYREQFNSILARSSFDDLLRQLKARAERG